MISYNEKSSILAFLLAFSCGFIAQASIVYPVKDETSSNSGTAAQGRVNQDAPQFTSVVQDWNSVCNQLCGAGLGGPACGPQCAKRDQSEHPNLTHVSLLMGTQQTPLCADLCKFSLGGSVCPCNEVPIIRAAITVDRNAICRSFCQNNHLTLTGCSPCQIVEQTTTTTTPSSTTPNWDKVCAALCKTGDGGALCNCDLPPFL